MGSTHQITLDHLAIAAERGFDNFIRYYGDLGGEITSGDLSPGFFWSQLRFAGGMKIEMLEPENVSEFDFLRRFLDRNGPGPHHLTFYVPDIEVATARAEELGFTISSTDFSGPEWKEAFLHPKSSCGIVIQLAWSAEDETPPPRVIPRPRNDQAEFMWVEHLVADLEAARVLFVDLLQGTVAGDSPDDPLGASITMTWPGGGRIVVRQPTDPRRVAWLGKATGRVFLAAFTIETTVGIADAHRVETGYEIPPEHNQGLRLSLMLT